MKKTTTLLYLSGAIGGTFLSLLYAYVSVHLLQVYEIINSGALAWWITFCITFLALLLGPVLVSVEIQKIGALMYAFDPERRVAYFQYKALLSEKCAQFLLRHPLFFYGFICVPGAYLLFRFVIGITELIQYTRKHNLFLSFPIVRNLKWKGYR